MNKKKTILSVSLTALMLISTNSYACLTNEIESNNNEGAANTDVCSNTTIAGNLSRNDIDWFEFQVSQAGTIDISLSIGRTKRYFS